ncbi:helix-turn-helix domain-containing protein [Morganella morganii]
MQNIQEPIKAIGVAEVAKACGVSERAVYKWIANGFLPKTSFFKKLTMRKKSKKSQTEKYQASELLKLSKQQLLAP